MKGCILQIAFCVIGQTLVLKYQKHHTVALSLLLGVLVVGLPNPLWTLAFGSGQLPADVVTFCRKVKVHKHMQFEPSVKHKLSLANELGARR